MGTIFYLQSTAHNETGELLYIQRNTHIKQENASALFTLCIRRVRACF